MIPAATLAVLGTSRRVIEFDGDGLYYVEGPMLIDLEALMRRLGTERRMDADEMRDWMNRLHVGLRAIEGLKVVSE